MIVAPSTRDLEILAGKLTQWMAARMPEASDLRLTEFSYPKGAGQSHETILFDAEWREGGAARAQGFVVRIKPSSFTVFPDNLFDEQYQLMKVLSDGDYVRVAKPLWFEADADLLGAPFFVMEKVKGRVPVSVPPYAKTGWLSEATPAQRRHLWEGAVRQLAAIQLVPLDKVQFLAGSGDAREGLAQEWDKYTRFVDWVKDDPRAEILEAGRQRLLSLWPKNQPEGLVWGDARIGNMMFDENFDVVAVMDWEQPSLGGALQDLAWFCTLSEIMHGKNSPIGAPLEGMGTREETIALWEEITGKSAADLAWYEEFTQLKMACTGVRMDGMRGTQMSSAESLKVRLKV
ncbi:phosphotransferase family protein [Novosphingobium sp. JCM 18896]|uniref:phosphotransferase family protein n=1 Tax=Novosphingobium sp. JCM 18896 TaxID=2989731 RepID=UPI00222268C5|nr:phosphotransferase family protein [Novosphingobium sp. JCM 18896]MCW1427628.1 phosphotransferase family protein [Novosphingobium sp. JCM 18896]